MPADAAKLPPFRKLPFKAPDMEVRRGEGGEQEGRFAIEHRTSSAEGERISHHVQILR